MTSLPDFLPAGKAELSVVSPSALKVQVFDRSSGSLVPVPENGMVAPILFENTDYNFYLEADDPDTRLRLSQSGTLRHRRNGSEHHTLNFRNDVGLTELHILGPVSAIVRLEVLPVKIDYRRDYALMRDEVDSIARGLALAAQARTYGRVGTQSQGTTTLVAWVALMRRYFDELVAAAEAIGRNPHSRLEKTTRLVAPDRLRRVDETQLRRALRRHATASGPILPGTGLGLPRRLPETTSRVTTDTPENRLVKAQLRQTLRNVQALLRSAGPGDEDADPNAEQLFLVAVKPEAESMRRRLGRLLLAPYLREVADVAPASSGSLVFQQHPHYAAFARIYRLLDGGLTFHGDALSVGVKQISQLYEYWCFLTIVRLLAVRFRVESHNLVRVRNTRLTLVLAKGIQAAVTFRCLTTGQKLHLLYNRLFNRLPTVSQQPDNVIQLAGSGALYVFDAKYRLAFDPEYRRRYAGPGPTTDDINVMHRYRDAIVLPPVPSQPEYRRPVVGAYVLFPFADEAGYMGHRFYASVASVGIGGLPLLPGATSLLAAKLEEILAAQGFVSVP
ncbi:Predicted component of virus defense system, contains PD-(D/E)xK nuclease domain, DUF524 [Hymenobacter psychrotolerans DSM 18569]|uniref:Predicted component of virus defense system, contains PD-(D/E)xK nuclease domain, DUF524 n=2 Tax=Hymenobacter psychrotolerans TaxID=344998 RepID=A0A1M7EFM4_9BACT|nr:Predicted component of virus defense system, contains PD-(D/E)xK nuclease domain, DUF524 [Hymenobacter psychrotolerans DSM 18569]